MNTSIWATRDLGVCQKRSPKFCQQKWCTLSVWDTHHPLQINPDAFPPLSSHTWVGDPPLSWCSLKKWYVCPLRCNILCVTHGEYFNIIEVTEHAYWDVHVVSLSAGDTSASTGDTFAIKKWPSELGSQICDSILVVTSAIVSAYLLVTPVVSDCQGIFFSSLFFMHSHSLQERTLREYSVEAKLALWTSPISLWNMCYIQSYQFCVAHFLIRYNCLE